MFRKYKMQNFKVNSHILDKEYQKMLMAEDQSAQEASFKKMADKVCDIIATALKNDEKLLILSTDLDSTTCSMIIYFLMKNYKMTYTNAMGLVRERWITLSINKI